MMNFTPYMVYRAIVWIILSDLVTMFMTLGVLSNKTMPSNPSLPIRD